MHYGGTTSLAQLWLGNSPKVRWETFLGCFSNTFSHQLLFERVPFHFIVLCIVLNHMIQNLNIEEWEIDAFIAQGIIVNKCDVSFLKKINIDRLNARAVHLSSIFMRGVSCSLFVLCTCSYPFPMSNAMPWNFFDGKLFHHFYLRAMQKERFVNHRERIKFPLAMFLKLKGVIVENTKFQK
uniref:Uncharacterized protein n=1 Tax=Strigamia maritima TaxID=126957 RepID=T1IPW3_STRMM